MKKVNKVSVSLDIDTEPSRTTVTNFKSLYLTIYIYEIAFSHMFVRKHNTNMSGTQSAIIIYHLQLSRELNRQT